MKAFFILIQLLLTFLVFKAQEVPIQQEIVLNEDASLLSIPLETTEYAVAIEVDSSLIDEKTTTFSDILESSFSIESTQAIIIDELSSTLDVNLNEETISTTVATSSVKTSPQESLPIDVNYLQDDTNLVELNACIYISCKCNYVNNNEINDIICENDYNLSKRLKSSLKKTYKINNFIINNITNFFEFPTNYFIGLNISVLIANNNLNLKRLLDDDFIQIKTTIKKLDLSKNSIKSISKHAFNELNNLIELNIESNQIEQLHHLLKLPQSLVKIDLANNLLTRIEKFYFSNVNQLKRLNLNENRINTIDANAFQNLDSIEYIDLSYNFIDNLDTSLFQSNVDTLKELKLDANNFYRMSRVILTQLLQNLTQLTVLTVSKNQLKHFPNMNNLINLKKLDLSHNKFESIEYLAKYLPSPSSKLEELNLSHNLLMKIDNNRFKNLNNLKILNLESNKIQIISTNAFNFLFNLERLNLKRNYLKQIPNEQIYNLIKLDFIDLSFQEYPGDPLRLIDDYSFDRNQTLANELQIQNFINYYSHINLRGNPITYIGKRAFCSVNKPNKQVKIKRLDLHDANIHHLNPCIFKQISSDTSRDEESRIHFTTKFLNEQFRLSINLYCDCDVIRYLELNNVKLKGSCILNDNGLSLFVAIDSLNCNKNFNSTKLALMCKNLYEYDCKKEYLSKNIPKQDHYWYAANDAKFKSNQSYYEDENNKLKQQQYGGASGGSVTNNIHNSAGTIFNTNYFLIISLILLTFIFYVIVN